MSTVMQNDLSSYPAVESFPNAVIRGACYHILYQHNVCPESADMVLHEIQHMVACLTENQTLEFLHRALPSFFKLPSTFLRPALDWWNVWLANTAEPEWWATCVSLLHIDFGNITNWSSVALSTIVEVPKRWQRCTAARLHARLNPVDRDERRLDIILQLLSLCTPHTKLPNQLLQLSTEELVLFLNAIDSFPKQRSRAMTLWCAQCLLIDRRHTLWEKGAMEMIALWHEYPTLELRKQVRDGLREKAKKYQFSLYTFAVYIRTFLDDQNIKSLIPHVCQANPTKEAS